MDFLKDGSECQPAGATGSAHLKVIPPGDRCAGDRRLDGAKF